MYKKNRPTAKAPEDYKLSCPLRAPPWAVEDFMGSLSRLRSPLDPGALKRPSRKSAHMVRRGTVYPSENGDFCCHTQKSQQI